jgi:phosphohistidine phosphatase
MPVTLRRGSASNACYAPLAVSLDAEARPRLRAMAPRQHTLVVVRHAKAEQVAATDLERELTDQGRADAAATGEWLAAAGVRPDHALVSAATRAAQTWEALAGGAGWSLDADLDPGLYSAGPDTALDVVRAVDEGCGTVVLVGHNPTMAVLAQLLDDAEGDVGAGNAMATGFPPSAVAVFVVTSDWADLEVARLTGFHVGRG